MKTEVLVVSSPDKLRELQALADKKQDAVEAPHMDFIDMIEDYIDKYGMDEVVANPVYNGLGELILTYEDALAFLD